MFQTIEYCFYENKEGLDKAIDDIPNTQGIFLIFGEKRNEMPKTINCLAALPTKQLHNFICCSIERWTSHKNFNHLITSIKYMEISDTLIMCKKALHIIKAYQPIFLKADNPFGNGTIKEDYMCSDNPIFINNAQRLNDSNFININKIETLPNECGIYFIYNEEYKLVYIGKTIHLKSRLIEHIYKRTHTWDISDNFKYIKYIIIDKALLEDFETYCINKFKPLLNIAKVYTYNSERYNPKYNSTLAEFKTVENLWRYINAKIFIEKQFNLQELIYKKEKELNDLKDFFSIY